MLTVKLQVENIGGEWFGWMETLPGAFSAGATPQEAMEKAPAALIEYVRWLNGYNEPVPIHLSGLTSADVRAEMQEESLSRRSSLQSEMHAVAQADDLPLDDGSLETYARLLGYAGADVRKAVRALDPESWDTAPLGGRSVSAMLGQLAEVKQTCLSELQAQNAVPSADDAFGRWETVHGNLYYALRSLPASQQEKSVLLDGKRVGLRKAMRRILGQTRQTAAQIAERSNPMRFMQSAMVDPRLLAKGMAAVVSERADSNYPEMHYY